VEEILSYREFKAKEINSDLPLGILFLCTTKENIVTINETIKLA